MSLFVVGHPARDDYFYDRNTELNAILAQRWTWICGQRRMGKTSLLFRLRAASEARGWIPLFLNLAHIRESQACGEVLFEKLFKANSHGSLASYELSRDEFVGDDSIERFGQLLTRLLHKNREVILLFDEAERLLHLEENDCGFLESLRGLLHDLDGLRFVIAGTQGLTELFGRKGRCSQFLSAFRYRPLGPFTPEVARSLLNAEQTGGWRQPLEDPLIESAVSWCGGHPLFLQELGALLEEGLEAARPSDRLLEECFRELIANPTLREIVADDFARLVPSQQAVLTAVCKSSDPVGRACLAAATGYDLPEIEVATQTLANFGYIQSDDPVRLRFLFYRRMLPSTASRVEPEKFLQLVGRRLFISYAHRDAEWLEKLTRFLDPILGNHVEIWDDRRILPGDHWREEIDRALDDSRIVLLLISSDFLASRFISEGELSALLTRNRLVLCLHVRPSALTSKIPRDARHQLHVLAGFQALNNPENPLSTLPKPEQEKVLSSIAVQISRLACNRL